MSSEPDDGLTCECGDHICWHSFSDDKLAKLTVCNGHWPDASGETVRCPCPAFRSAALTAAREESGNLMTLVGAQSERMGEMDYALSRLTKLVETVPHMKLFSGSTNELISLSATDYHKAEDCPACAFAADRSEEKP